jgi:hypothetical protein
VICPHCSKSFRLTQVQAHRGQGLAAQIQCYHCQAWLGRSAALARLKMLGFYLALAMGVACYTWPGFRGLAICIGIFALMLLLVSHLMDHLHTVEAPEKPDDSEHRQKYR